MILREYQKEILNQLKKSKTNDIVQLDTGAGKTPIMAALAKSESHCILVAHRNTLIRQISEKMAAFGIYHDTISTKYTRNRCAQTHRQHGKRFIRHGEGSHYVASIASLISRVRRGRLSLDRSKKWLIIIDEAHHVVPKNQWGVLKKLFPNARVVGFTATPARMSGESLHVSNGGLFDKLIQAPSLAENSVGTLIEQGYLSDFDAYVPPVNRVQFDELSAHPVNEYQRLAKGTQAIVMCQTIRKAYAFAECFMEAGISAACINSNQSNTMVARILDKFEAKEIKVVCNVDMIGEGFDLPAISTLIIAANTGSFIRYRQWIGRVLRPSHGKETATIIDLTGATKRHGLPDSPVKWDLLKPPVSPSVRKKLHCRKCGFYYLITMLNCPKCGQYNSVIGDERGGHLIEAEYNYLNKETVLHERNKVSQARLKKALEERKNKGLVKRIFNDPPGVIGNAIEKIREWFISSLEKSGFSYSEINDFIESKDADNYKFWMANFNVKDISGSAGKAKRVFKEWKSQS